MINMTQSSFDYITINSDSSESDYEEEENEFKDKFSVVIATNNLDCNICLQTFYRYYIFFKCNKCTFQICPLCFNSFYFVYNYKTCAICKS